MTHDLLESVIQSLGAQVNHILVSDLSDDTFYAKIVLQHNGSQTEIDSRPSDAIALAVRTQAPIFASDSVVDKAGVRMDQDTGKAVISSRGGRESSPTEEELKSLSAFSEFIDSLDLDLGEGGDKPTGAAR